MVTLQLCSIGEYQDSVCNKTFHTRDKIGLIQASELSMENIELVIWRTGIHKNILNTICIHHIEFKLFLMNSCFFGKIVSMLYKSISSYDSPHSIY